MPNTGTPEKVADAVFEGGGVKGIGLVGAVAEIENQGYRFENLAGTSAGAIVASLLAVGYTGAELKEEIEKLNYNDFKDENWLDKLSVFGKALSVIYHYGIFKGEFFEHWLQGLLRKKGKTTFGDLRTKYTEEQYRYKFQAIASDITDRKMLVLPRDIAQFGDDPDRLPIARAVRMSMSIPLFFEAVPLRDRSGGIHYIVDGGVLSNYPIWLLDDGTSDPAWPTFGFKLIEPGTRTLRKPSSNPVEDLAAYFEALVGTMLDAHDNYHISESSGDFERTMAIPTVVQVGGQEKQIRTTDFGITREESEALYQNGATAAKNFLATWDFTAWKQKYRQKSKGQSAAGNPS
jgi:NTE family protein